MAINATVPGYESVLELDNTIFDEQPILSTASDPIDMSQRMYLNLDVDFTIGSLTNIILTIQAWNGAEWVNICTADGTNVWSVTISGTQHRAMLVGDDTTLKSTPSHILWNVVRIRVVATGSTFNSVLTIRYAAK